MKPDLIVIANAAHASLYTRPSDRAPLALLEAMAHEQSHLRASELGDDRPGHARSDQRPTGVSLNPATDPHRKQQQQFAQQLSHRIDELLNTGSCERLSVFAASPFLGEIKGHLSRAAHDHLRAAVDLDLTHFPIKELQERIEHAMRSLHTT